MISKKNLNCGGLLSDICIEYVQLVQRFILLSFFLEQFVFVLDSCSVILQGRYEIRFWKKNEQEEERH